MSNRFTADDLERLARSRAAEDPGARTESWEAYAIAAVARLDDVQLTQIWESAPDHEKLSPVIEAVIDEMGRREIDF